MRQGDPQASGYRSRCLCLVVGCYLEFFSYDAVLQQSDDARFLGCSAGTLFLSLVLVATSELRLSRSTGDFHDVLDYCTVY